MNEINELQHHGILGMRWGIRRTPEQLGYPPAEPRKTADGKVGTYKTKGHVTDADYGITKSKLAKGDSSNTNSNNKSDKNKPRELTKFQKSLVRVNRKENEKMTQEEAERMAVYQDRAKKIAIAVAAGALAAGTAYCIYKARQDSTDPYKDFDIKPGNVIQRITPHGDNAVREQFYGAVNKQDKRQYIYKMADWKGHLGLYQQEMRPKENIKVAGIDTCDKLFNDLRSNDVSFANALRRDYRGTPDYAQFNRDMIAKHQLGPGNAFQLFQDHLKKRGYGALIDHNDSKGMGWGTERPIIFFGQQGNLDSTVKRLGNESIVNAKKQFFNQQETDTIVNSSIVPIAGIGGTSALTAGMTYLRAMRSDRQIVNEYKKLHPNTKMNDSEILDMFDKK